MLIANKSYLVCLIDALGLEAKAGEVHEVQHAQAKRLQPIACEVSIREEMAVKSKEEDGDEQRQSDCHRRCVCEKGTDDREAELPHHLDALVENAREMVLVVLAWHELGIKSVPGVQGQEYKSVPAQLPLSKRSSAAR